MKKLFINFPIFFLLFMGALSAQGENSASSTSASIPSSSGSQSALWAFRMGTNLQRSLDENADFLSTFNFSANRPLKNGVLSVDASFYNRWARYEDPQIRGMEDVRLNWQTPFTLREWVPKNPTTDPQFFAALSLSLPTSETSQKATLNANIESSLSGTWPLGSFSISHGHSIYFFSHTYDTADVAGFKPNPQAGISNYIHLEIPLPLRMQISISGQYFSIWNYSNKQTDIQSLKGQWGGQVTPQLYLYTEVSTKNQRISNISLFDDDNSRISMGGVYVL
jgi:hypothetical protein